MPPATLLHSHSMSPPRHRLSDQLDFLPEHSIMTTNGVSQTPAHSHPIQKSPKATRRISRWEDYSHLERMVLTDDIIRALSSLESEAATAPVDITDAMRRNLIGDMHLNWTTSDPAIQWPALWRLALTPQEIRIKVGTWLLNPTINGQLPTSESSGADVYCRAMYTSRGGFGRACIWEDDAGNEGKVSKISWCSRMSLNRAIEEAWNHYERTRISRNRAYNSEVTRGRLQRRALAFARLGEVNKMHPTHENADSKHPEYQKPV